MGPADRDQHIHGGDCVASAARDHRPASRRKTEHGKAVTRRSVRDGWWITFHRLDRRQPIPCSRREDRQATLDNEARTTRQLQSNHLARKEWQAVRRGGCNGYLSDVRASLVSALG